MRISDWSSDVCSSDLCSIAMLEKPDHEDADQDRPEQRRNGFERAEHVHHRFAAEDQVTERQQREVNNVRAQYLTECHFGLAQFQGRTDGYQFGQSSRFSYEGEPANRARISSMPAEPP